VRLRCNVLTYHNLLRPGVVAPMAEPVEASRIIA
jgi:hypothetical protein